MNEIKQQYIAICSLNSFERAGIITFLNDAQIALKVIECIDFESLLNILARYQINYIFISTRKLQAEHTHQLNKFKQTGNNEITVVAFGNENKATELKYDYFLPTSENYKKDNSLLVKIFDEGITEKSINLTTGLSDRELDIIRLVARGKTNKEISEHLFLSPHTVITHRKNITSKLGIKSISGLTVYAIMHNLIDMSDVNM